MRQAQAAQQKVYRPGQHRQMQPGQRQQVRDAARAEVVLYLVGQIGLVGQQQRPHHARIGRGVQPVDLRGQRPSQGQYARAQRKAAGRGGQIAAVCAGAQPDAPAPQVFAVGKGVGVVGLRRAEGLRRARNPVSRRVVGQPRAAVDRQGQLAGQPFAVHRHPVQRDPERSVRALRLGRDSPGNRLPRAQGQVGHEQRPRNQQQTERERGQAVRALPPHERRQPRASRERRRADQPGDVHAVAHDHAQREARRDAGQRPTVQPAQQPLPHRPRPFCIGLFILIIHRTARSGKAGLLRHGVEIT